MSIDKMILVSGIPRSGTTAVGDMLSLGRNVGSLYEPLNYHIGSSDIQKYFQFPGQDGFSWENIDKIVCDIRRLNLEFKKIGSPEDQGIKKIVKRLYGGRPRLTQQLCKVNPFLDTIVWKDPFASFFLGYLYRQHNINVVVTLRNPWAVAGSFKRMRWSFDLERIYHGLETMGISFSLPYEFLSESEGDSVKNSVLLWYAIYSKTLQELKDKNRILLVDLDKLVKNPLQAYKNIYKGVGLPWTNNIEKKIVETYSKSSSRPSEPRPGVTHDKRRDFTQVNTYYKKILTSDEVDFVTQVSGNLWYEILHYCND